MEIPGNFLKTHSYTPTVSRPTDSDKHQPSLLQNTLKSTSIESPPELGVKQADQSPGFRTYEGKYQSVILPASDATAFIDSFLSKLSVEDQQALIDADLLQNDDFIALAQTLSSKELGELTDVLVALTTPARLNLSVTDLSGKAIQSALIDTLSSLQGESRSRVLAQATEYAAQVAPKQESHTYDADGQPSILPQSDSANDIYNFVNAINQADDVNALLDDLALFSEQAQSDLLYVLGADIVLGERLMAQLEARDEKTQDAVLAFIPDVVRSVAVVDIDMTLQQPDGVSSVLDHDNNDHDTLWGMISDTVSLLDNYGFSDEQLQNMGDALDGLDISDQRAYLQITQTGLEQLVGLEPGKTIDVSHQQQAFDALDALRENRSVRDLVFKSRMGEKTVVDGRSFYEVKSPGTGERDQEKVIQVLIADARLTGELGEGHRIGENTVQLAHALTSQDAKTRDALVSTLTRYGPDMNGFVERDMTALLQEHQGFLNRTTALAHTEDVGALLTYEAGVEPPFRDIFWQAVAFAEDDGDEVAQLLAEGVLVPES